MVGMPGSAGKRVRVVTASARMRPAFTCDNAACGVANTSEICPAISSVSAGAPPLYGT